MSANPFSPSGSTVKVTVASSSTAVDGTIAANSNATAVRVVNTGTISVFVKINGATAAATDIPMLPGTVEVFQLGGAFGTAATVSILGFAATSSDVYFTPGVGI